MLEITEHEPVPDYQELRRRLQMWSAASTMLAIDDVGAGYSSMSHVLQLHPHFIKIDRSLVHKAHRDPNKLAVLRGLVGFARQGGIPSLAEGVETTEELKALRAVGIDLVQGCLSARPGDGWPQPRRWRSARSLSADGQDTSATLVESLVERVEKTLDPTDAADEVTAYLNENFEFLPSVHVERAGVLRFLSGRGQWQVLDGIEAGVLEDAFARTGLTTSRGSPLVDFGWHAPRIAESRSIGEMAVTTVTASVAVARLQSAVLWTRARGSLVQQGSTGARADAIASLSPGQLEQLAGLVSHVASSYSTGPVISRTFGPMGIPPRQGFGTVFVAAIRDRGVPSGLLVLAGPDVGIIEREAVPALELLCVLVGVTLARIGPA